MTHKLNDGDGGRPSKLWMKAVGVLVALAMGVPVAGVTGTAFAADSAPTTGDTTTSSAPTTGSDKTDAAAKGDAGKTDAKNDGQAAGDTTGSDADTSTPQADQPAKAPAASGDVDCSAVIDYATLKSCVESGRNTGIAASITVKDTNATIAVPAGSQVTLYAAVKNASIAAMTSGDPLFDVASTGRLIIGFPDDASFISYSGKSNLNDDLQGGRPFSKLESGANLDIYGGVFEDITVAKGAVALSNGGNITINGGTFQNNKATDYYSGLVDMVGGALTINGGTFRNNTGVRGSVVSSEPDKGKADITINGGVFADNSTSYAGGVIMQNNTNGTITIQKNPNGGPDAAAPSFTDNTSNTRGGVIHSNGKLTISAGEFKGNKAKGLGGGAISQGEWKDKFLYPNAVATITGGTFENNAKTFGDNVVCNTSDSAVDKCRGNNLGGGAIYADSGTLNIVGNVTFKNNHSKAWGWYTGGGAVYMRGTLWIRNDDKGNKPQFVENWAGEADTQYIEENKLSRGGAGGAIFLDGSSTAYLMGGNFQGNTSGYLGGAIYTEEDSTTYIGKAVATKNVAGHFGGGLWLCPSGVGEGSKGGNIAMFDNSVNKSIDSNADNANPYHGKTYRPSWDRPTPSDTTYPDTTYDDTNTDGTEAGDDFAMMNPAWKKYNDRTFLLMDTWFTDRTKTAVDWYRDGTPVREASGYEDEYQNPGVYTTAKGYGEKAGTLAVTKNGGRYVTDTAETRVKTKIAMTDHANTLVLTRGDTKGAYKTGLALKAVKPADMSDKDWAASQQDAKDGALVTFTGNKARLNGGAFGTNGNVKFSTPFTASWSKTNDYKDKDKKDRKLLEGSKWDLTATTAGRFTGTGATEGEAIKDAIKQFDAAHSDAPVAGPFNVDFVPTLCPVTKSKDDNGNETTLYEEGYAEGKCWKQEFGSSSSYSAKWDSTEKKWKVSFNSITLSAVVTDNSGKGKKDTYTGMFDNNPTAGEFDLNNLAPGTYTLKERVAPTGYERNANEYRFKITNGPAKWQKLNDKDVPETDDNNGQPVFGDKTEIDIPNKALPGVSWSKVDADNPAETLENSTWKVTKYDKDGNLESTSRWVVDCVQRTDKDTNCLTQAKNEDDYIGDHDPAAGKFNISRLDPGTYQLVEDTTPDGGYWDPETGDVYEFTVPKNVSDDTVVPLKKKTGETSQKVSAITNKLPQLSWSKIDADTHKIITGSKTRWELRGPVAVLVSKDGKAVTDTQEDPKTGVPAEITAEIDDCESKDGADASTACSAQKTGVQQRTGAQQNTNTVEYYYNDLDNAVGQLKISGLPRPTTEQAAKNIRYQYVLKEKQQPAGYDLSSKEYVFNIGATESQSSLTLAGTPCSRNASNGNCIPNTKKPDKPSNHPSSNTGSFEKVGPDGKGLSGAEFTVYQTKAGAKDSDFVPTDKDKLKNGTVDTSKFDKVTGIGSDGVVTSGTDGKVSLDDWSDGTYYVVESGLPTAAADGKRYAAEYRAYLKIVINGSLSNATIADLNPQGLLTKDGGSCGENVCTIGSGTVRYENLTEGTKPPTPDTPHTPDKPNTPHTPNTPNKPNTPGTPDTPNSPNTPGSGQSTGAASSTPVAVAKQLARTGSSAALLLVAVATMMVGVTVLVYRYRKAHMPRHGA